MAIPSFESLNYGHKDNIDRVIKLTFDHMTELSFIWFQKHCFEHRMSHQVIQQLGWLQTTFVINIAYGTALLYKFDYHTSLWETEQLFLALHPLRIKSGAGC